jgi:adenylate kinase family enzyme
VRVNEIISSVEEGVDDPHIFKAVFMAGGPGSGKSRIADSPILKGGGLRPINSDDVYEYKMKKAGLDYGDPDVIYSDQGQEIRGRAKEVTAKREQMYLDGRLGIIIDGTGRDINKIATAKEKLVKMGYSCMMVFVNTSLEIAQERNVNRERTLKPEEVSRMWNDVQNNMMKFQQLFGKGKFQIVDNNGGLEDPERKKNFEKVQKNVTAFLSRPPSNPYAKKWIENERRNKTAINQQEK